MYLLISPAMRTLILSLLLASSPAAASTEKIPNENWQMARGIGDQSLYSQILRKFDAFKAIKTKASRLKMRSPLNDPDLTVLTHFGTPTIISISDEGGAIYTHEALDITRSNDHISDDVFAPVSGQAILVSEDESSHYTTAVAILDEKSNLVVSLLHIDPVKTLKANQFTTIKAGEKIGRLNLVASMVNPNQQEHYKHTHLSLLDLQTERLLNPLPYFKQYQDHVKPFVTSVSIFDQNGSETQTLVDGKIDLTFKAFDRDDRNQINFELKSFSAQVTDQKGKILYEVPQCDLDFLTENLERDNVVSAFNLRYIGRFRNLDFGIYSNGSVSNREFEYVLTHFKNTPDENCRLIDDDQGFLEITPDITSIKITVDATDTSGNTTKYSQTLRR